MPFIPAETKTTPTGNQQYWKVSASEQAKRDADAANIVAAEYANETDPDQQRIIASEYRQRFNSEPPSTQGSISQTGFVPLEGQSGFVPLDQPKPSVLKQIALENPLAAIGEAAMNLGSQAIAMPVAGLAGLATEGARALGLTDTAGADVVHSVGEKLTYQPRGEMGKGATEIATYPFQKLAEAGQHLGNKTLDATGSPLAATAVDTAVNALPMAISPAKKVVSKVIREKPGAVVVPEPVIDPAAGPLSRSIHSTSEATATRTLKRADGTPPESQGFVPLGETDGVRSVADPAKTMAISENEMRQPMRTETRTESTPESTTESARHHMQSVQESVRKSEGFVPLEFSDAADMGMLQPNDAPLLRRGDASQPERAPADAHSALASGTTRQTVDGPAGFTPLIEPDAVAAKKAVIEVAPEVMESNQAMIPGASYVPLINDAVGSKVASVTDKPIRREDVLRPLAKALGVPLYQGRIKGKALGTYTPKKEVVRLKKANDIEVAAHELAHLIDDRIPDLSKQYRMDKVIASELRGVSYDKTKLHEGFAELVRLWATQPEKAKAAAPHAYQWFESFVNAHQYGPALRQAQSDMTAWFGQEALHRAQSKIGTTKTINDAVDGLWDKFRQSVSDDLHGIYKMERDLTGKVSPGGAYETARLSRAANSITEGAVRYGRPVKRADASFGYEGLGLEKILEPVADRLDNFLLYAVGKSASELMRQGREHLFTQAEIDAMLQLKQPDFEKAFVRYQAWNKGILDFAEAQGVINPEARKLWQRTSYLPFHRVGQAGESRSAKPGEWSGIKALTGGTDNLRDILGNILGNAATLMEKAIQNEARLKIAKLADEERGGGRFMVRVPTESRQVSISAPQISDAVLRKLGADPRKPLPPELAALQTEILKNPEYFDFLIGNQAPAGSNIVAVMRNGKREYYEVGDPVLYRSLLSLDREPAHWLTQWLGIPKRVGQATVTLTPDFMIANIARDTLMGAVMSRAGFRPVIDSLQGMRLRLTNDPLYKDFIANGGGLSSYLLDEKRMRHHLERFYSKQGIDYRTVMDAPDKLLLGIETIADSFEMSTRLGEYKRAIERGEHPRHAAYLGREVSTDFAMKGDSKTLGFMYDTVMFLRPMVSSFDRLYRGLAHDENRGAIAAKTGLLALSSMALHLLNQDNPEYQDLPDWDRDSHWHFFVPTADGETVHLRYPKIWEIGAVASVAERSLEKVIKNDPAGLGKDMGRIIANVFHFNLMPQAFAPLYEQATNENKFTGARIETPGMEQVQPFLRAKPNTSETMKALGMATRDLPESMQVNPARAEALLRGYFNTWALYGLTIADEALFSNEMPERRLDQMPVIRRFYEGKPAIHTRHEEMFYDILGEAYRLQGTLRRLDKIGKSDIADEKQDDPLALQAKQLERVSKRLHGINEEIQSMHRADISREEKRQRIDALFAERNELIKQTVLEVKSKPELQLGEQ